MHDVVFVTGNTNKALQVRKWLGVPIDQIAIDLDEIQSPQLETVVEHKARQAYARLRRPVFVEDVELVFAAIKPLPGPFIKWFELPGLPVLCQMLDGFGDRTAYARLLYGLCDGEMFRVFEGRMDGRISEAPRGAGGFGFDPVFINDGHTVTRAEMDEATYAATSYRKQAVKGLGQFLKGYHRGP